MSENDVVMRGVGGEPAEWFDLTRGEVFDLLAGLERLELPELGAKLRALLGPAGS